MRFVGGLVLAVMLAGPVAAQARPLDSTTVNSLWPERVLTPAEAELRAAVVVLRDSLYQVDAAVERVERGKRGDASPAMLRSAGLALAAECHRSERASERMQMYAAGLSTSDTRWGDGALATYRESLVSLRRALSNCEQQVRSSAEGNSANADQLSAAAEATRVAVRGYEQALKGLLRTLKIPLEPRGAETSNRG